MATASSGLWNNPRAAQRSKEAQDMMRIIKQESRLTSLQRRHSNKPHKNGSIVHMTCESAPPSASEESVQKRPVCHPQKRSAESCRAGDSYTREKFHPGLTRDLEKEKRRLQSIMATGEEPRTAMSKKAPARQNPDVSEEPDRYQEVLDEIEERRQFLADMASLGQEKQYADMINTEISQKIRELELLDKTSVRK
ncbi:UPF0193 protein EVG1 [Parambassis ranga]|uniref:UPF0193 protein EVG1 n=1 Tax=Parambassis ranga TaxID=210632 RepID=A0A6P7JUY6_9TELE|nr:UPF0193 protein EVG1 [Parambassis ranga]